MKFEEFERKVDELGALLVGVEESKLDITTLKAEDVVFRAQMVLHSGETSIVALHCIVDKVTKKQFILRCQGLYMDRYQLVSGNFGGWKQSREDAILAFGLEEFQRLSHIVNHTRREMLHGGLSAEAVKEALEEQMNQVTADAEKSSTP